MSGTPATRKALAVRAVPAAEPIADFDRWLALYVATVARAAGIPVPSSEQAA